MSVGDKDSFCYECGASPAYISEDFGGRPLCRNCIGKRSKNVISPHYRKGAIEPIDFISAQKLNFNLGCAVKYISRCNYKGAKEEDLRKAIWYLEREINDSGGSV